MGDIRQKTTDVVESFGQRLKDMSSSMQVFSFNMRSLYAEKAFSTNDILAVKFRKLRDDTRNDAMVYLKFILPVSTKFVSCIAEYFDVYISLEYEDWCDMLKDILEDTTGYKQLCSTLLKMHEKILVPLKKRQDESKILIMEFKDLKEKYKEQKKALEVEAKASHHRYIPEVRENASSLLKPGDADSTKPAATFGSALIKVSEALIPALEQFIDGLRQSAGFFSVMEQELLKFEDKADKALENPKKLYYKVMNTQAGNMRYICQTFYAVLPDVRTDFLAIPTEGTDQNYVDEWLAHAKTLIQENVTTQKLVQKLMISITG